MLHIAIAEDDTLCAGQIEKFLLDYRSEFSEPLHISLYATGAALMEEFHGQFDLILLDVEMPEMDGLTTAHKIRQLDPEVILIFVTNMAQYAIRGYEVDATDYILKPLSYFSFTQRLSRAISRLKQREKHYVVLSVKGRTLKLDVDEIYYVESQGHNLIYHTVHGDHIATSALKHAEEVLSGYGFFRCNSGYLVSLRHVDSVQGNSVSVGGQELLISRSRKNAFMTALTNYLGSPCK